MGDLLSAPTCLYDLPETCHYVPNFVTANDEQYILAEIAKLPETRWTILSHRRLLSVPSQLTGKTRDVLLEAPLPLFLTRSILDGFKTLGIFAESPHAAPNHCLVNEYKPGQGIMPHEDGPAYYPTTATISLGSHTVLDVYEKTKDGERQTNPRWRVLQEQRSLLVTAGTMYTDTIHGIAEEEVDKNLNQKNIVNWDLLEDQTIFESGFAIRGTRTSLTYRDVLKVAKLGGAMKLINKK